MGERKHTEGKVSRRQKRQAPPCGFRNGKVSRRQKRQASLAHRQHPPPPAPPGASPPAGRVVCSPAPVPRPAQPRGCKGRSPLHEITIVSPFPGGEGGRGDGGRKEAKGRVSRRQKKASPPADSETAKSAGDQKGKPPSPPAPPKKPPPWLTCTETQPRIVHPVQPPERKAKKIRKLFGKPVDKPRKECYNGNATGA